MMVFRIVRLLSGALAAMLVTFPAAAMAETTHAVRLETLVDQKAVFATVESPNVVPARSRIGGTIASLAVRQGDTVTQGQVIAVVGDDSWSCRSTRSTRRSPVCSRRPISRGRDAAASR